jgi:hypothetical protein
MLGRWFIDGRGLAILTGHTIIPSMRMIGDNSQRRRVNMIAAMSVDTGGWMMLDVFDDVVVLVARVRRSVMNVVLIRLVGSIAIRPMLTIAVQLSFFPATS